MGKLKKALSGGGRFLLRLLLRSRLLCFDHVGVCAIVFALIGALAALSINLTIFSPLKRALDDFSMTDVYYEIERMGGLSISNDIVLVDITALHSRADIARTVRAITACQPRVMVVDVIFEREGEDIEGNIDLINAFDEAREHSILSCKLTKYAPESDNFEGVTRSFFAPFGQYQWAYCNMKQAHIGGVLRNYTRSQRYRQKPVYSMAYAAACAYEGVEPQPDGKEDRPIVYGDLDFMAIKHFDVAAHPELLRDKIVMVGTLSTEEDSHFTPVGKMPGLKCQAYAVASILDHRTIHRMSTTASLLLAFLLCYLCAWIGSFIQRLPSPFYLYVSKFYYLGLTCLLAWLSFICFVRYYYNVSLVMPLLAIALVEEARLHYRVIIATLAKRKWGLRLVKHSIYLPK